MNCTTIGSEVRIHIQAIAISLLFKKYILINQDKLIVESFYKQDQNLWEISQASEPDQSLWVKSLDFYTLMKELYVSVNLEENKKP